MGRAESIYNIWAKEKRKSVEENSSAVPIFDASQGFFQDNFRCPKKYFCPASAGQSDSELSPEEEQHVFDILSNHKFQPDISNNNSFVFGMVETDKPVVHTLAESLKEKIYLDYKDTVFRDQIQIDPNPRGPHGNANIKLKPGTVPKYHRPIPHHGEKMEFLKRS